MLFFSFKKVVLKAKFKLWFSQVIFNMKHRDSLYKYLGLARLKMTGKSKIPLEINLLKMTRGSMMKN